MHYRLERDPHPHLVIEEIVPPDVYEAMRFPDEHIDPDSTWGITTSDPVYAEVLRDPAWKSLHDFLRGEPFVRDVLRLFAEDMRAAGCLVDPEAAKLGTFVESRMQKAQSVLATEGDPNDIFTRLDFQSKSASSYREFKHLDWARRIVGGILFFSDADEEGLVGGELAFYRDRDFKNDRWLHDPELVSCIRPKKNTGVIFLNANSAFHGPRAITALSGRRRWLYYSISSRLDVWPCEARAPEQELSAAQ